MADPIVLVTGGAGFIGHRVARLLVAEGYRPRVFDNRYRADDAVVEEFQGRDDIDWVEGDVRYRGRIESAMADVEGVIHLAAVCINKSVADPTESFDVNLTGSDNVFSAAATHGVRRVVFASSASVYGDPEALPMGEDDKLKPQTPYCIAKAAAEDLLRFYERTAGLSWNTLRYFNVYGPGQPVDAYYTSVINLFVRRILAGEAPTIDGDGSQSMDFIHVDDIARATVRAYQSPNDGVVANVGTGIDTSIADVARILIDELGVDVEPVFRPRNVLVNRRAADVTRARELLDFKAEIDVHEGLSALAREVVAAYRAEHG